MTGNGRGPMSQPNRKDNPGTHHLLPTPAPKEIFPMPDAKASPAHGPRSARPGGRGDWSIRPIPLLEQALRLMMGIALLLATLLTLWPALNPALLVASRMTSPPAEGIWTTFANGDDVRALALEADVLWAGTKNGGVVRWSIPEGTYVQYLYPQDGLAGNDVRGVVMDDGGRKWFATNRGVSILDDGGTADKSDDTWTTHLPNEDVTAIAMDSLGRVWVGTNGSGVARFDGHEWRTYTHDPENPSAGPVIDEISALIVDDADQVWVAYGHAGYGVSVFNGSRWITYTSINSALPWDKVMAMAPGYGGVWLGTWGRGACFVESHRFVTYTTADGLGSNYILTITIGQDGRAWFGLGRSSGGGKGVSLLDGADTPHDKEDDEWTRYREEDGLASDTVWAIAIGDGEAWFGTAPVCSGFGGCRGGGLSRFDVDQNQWCPPYTTAQTGLASNQITAIAFDAEGQA
ncbi:MAG TPA: hypothetical protein EYP55_01160, partial [Anaerolineae bacterium]|nr:hypothetical protein [Anaerolineae bacterium]